MGENTAPEQMVREMARIQSQKRRINDGAGPHCPYCRDTVSEGVIVECDQCQACYHSECVSGCVILGCTGSLLGKESADFPPVISVTEKTKTSRVVVTEKPVISGKRLLAEDPATVFRLSMFFLSTVFLALALNGGVAREFVLMLFLVLIFVAFYLFPASAEKRAEERELAKKRKARGGEAAEIEENQGESETAKRENFYAKRNIAPTPKDRFRPDS